MSDYNKICKYCEKPLRLRDHRLHRKCYKKVTKVLCFLACFYNGNDEHVKNTINSINELLKFD